MSFKNILENDIVDIVMSDLNCNKTQQNCQICGRPNGIMNFGAISCLACAAFFGRTITLSLSFKCKCQNGRKNKKAKFSFCKQCRLERCFEAGMKKELVRAVSMRSFHMKRQKEMLEKECPTLLQNSLISLHRKNSLDVGFFKLIELGELSYQAWFSMAPLPSKQLDKTLVELLGSHTNILTRNEKLTDISLQKFNKSEYLRSVENNGMTMEWHECAGRRTPIRSTLICISLLMALPAFRSLDLQDQITQIKGVVGIGIRLTLLLYSASKETIVLPTGVAAIEIFFAANRFYGKTIMENLTNKLFVSPMKMFANVGLDKLESILLIYILLCSPAASTGLSKEAQLILLKESERFGKMLLQLQQHRFGQQAGALRYMESQRLIWTAVEGKFIFQKMLPIFDYVVDNGISRTYPKIFYALYEN